MITLSRLNGQIVAINPDLITWIEVTPDTVVSLLGGDKIIVRESLDEVIARVIAYRWAIGTNAASPPTGEVLQRAKELRDSGRPPSLTRPPDRSSRPPIGSSFGRSEPPTGRR